MASLVDPYFQTGKTNSILPGSGRTIFGMSSGDASLLAASLKDAMAYFSGRSQDANSLMPVIQQNAQREQVQQLMQAVNSPDPAQRQQGYTGLLALGGDPTPFKAEQAAQQLPKIMGMQQNPQIQVTPPVSAAGLPKLPGATPLNDPGRIASNNFNAAIGNDTDLTPSLSATTTALAPEYPEAAQSLAPELFKQQLSQDAKVNEPYTLAPGDVRNVGSKTIASVPEKPTPNSPFNPDGTPNVAFQKYETDKQAAGQAVGWANYNLAKQKVDASVPDDATLHDMATRYVNGDRNAGSGMSRNPMAATAFQNMISQVGQERGLSQQQISQNLQTFHAGTKAVQAFDTGPQGNTTRSLNVAIQHLDTLGQLSDALGNGDVQQINKLGNTVSAQLGGSAPTNFNAAKAIVGDEVVKAIIGTGGALADRENAQNQINTASSPAQLKGVIDTYKKLMAGQLHGLRQQYESSTGMSDFNDKLFPETVNQLEAGAAPKAASPRGPMPTSALPRTGQPSVQDIVNELRRRGAVK